MMKPQRPLFDDLDPSKEYSHLASDFANWQHAHYMLEGYRAYVGGTQENPYPKNGQRYDSFERGWKLAKTDFP